MNSMYAEGWLKNATLPLCGNTDNLKLAAKVAADNLEVSDDDPLQFLVVGGVSGSGKTRLGYELMRMWDNPEWLGPLQAAVAGNPVHLVRLFVDFNNGGRHSRKHDGEDLPESLGARLAALALGISLEDVHLLNGSTLKGLGVRHVLSAVLERVAAVALGKRRSGAGAGGVAPRVAATGGAAASLAASGGAAAPVGATGRAVSSSAAAGGAVVSSAGASTASDRPTFLVVLHLDEYQAYVRRPRDHDSSPSTAGSLRNELKDVKEMVCEVNRFVQHVASDQRWRMSLLLILSGLPILGVPMKLTNKVRQRLTSPYVLTFDDAAKLVAAVLARDEADNPLAGESEFVAEALHDLPARAAVLDTGCRPRLLVKLGVQALKQVKEQCVGFAEDEVLSPTDAGMCALDNLDWKTALARLVDSFKDLDVSSPEQRVLVSLSLLQTPVRFAFPPGRSAETEPERVVAAAEKAGSVELELAPDPDYRIVRMPLVQFQSWCTAVFPPALLELCPAGSRASLEQLIVHVLKVRINSLLSPNVVELAQVLPGARGASSTLSLGVRARVRVEAYEEKIQLISQRIPVPPRSMSTVAREYGGTHYTSVALDKGVFYACHGSGMVDLRFSLQRATGRATRGAPGPSAGRPGDVACEPYVHVFVRTKHTGRVHNVSLQTILTWYEEVKVATAAWSAGSDTCVYVFVTNRRVAAGVKDELERPSFFNSLHDLLVITYDELVHLMSPSLVHRP